MFIIFTYMRVFRLIIKHYCHLFGIWFHRTVQVEDLQFTDDKVMDIVLINYFKFKYTGKDCKTLNCGEKGSWLLNQLTQFVSVIGGLKDFFPIINKIFKIHLKQMHVKWNPKLTEVLQLS